MSDRFSDSDAEREALSALADGEAPSTEVARACAAWRDRADARVTWHSYQVIGDVMRSEDLAQASSGSAFLKNFRERLAQEPVVLAPSAAQAQHRPAPEHVAQAPARALKRRAWAGPVAVAAGFVLVVGAMLSSQILPTSGSAGGANVAQSGQSSLPGGIRGADLSLASTGQWSLNGFVPDPNRASGVTVGGDRSFNAPGEVVIMRNPQLDQALAMQQRGNALADGSFAGQGALTRQVVFDGR